MKVAIVSDSHDHRALLRSAVASAVAEGAEAVLHCGDVVSGATLMELKEFNIPVHAIHGNNTGDLNRMVQLTNKPHHEICYYGQDAKLNLGGRNIFIVHYPEYARAFATTGEWDIVCCGHDHVLNMEWIDNMKGEKTLLLNPGSVAGLDGPATYLIGDLDTLEFERRDVATAPATV